MKTLTTTQKEKLYLLSAQVRQSVLLLYKDGQGSIHDVDARARKLHAYLAKYKKLDEYRLKDATVLRRARAVFDSAATLLEIVDREQVKMNRNIDHLMDY